MELWELRFRQGHARPEYDFGNTANFSGGGLSTGSQRYGGIVIVKLTQSTIAGNAAERRGGGVSNFFNFVTLTQSTISGDSADWGGGVYTDFFGSVSLTESTITGNTATVAGGGVFISYYSPVRLTSSLVAGNLAPTAPEVLQSGGTLTADAFNLFGVNGDAGVTGFTPGLTDLVPAEPLTAILDPVLADHGGPTLTHALAPGSPAIDAIPPGAHSCGTTLVSDQRWQARPQPAGGACDIAAYEMAVPAQALGGWVTGVSPNTVLCKNAATGQEVALHAPAPAWDCEAAGLGVTSGDQVGIRTRGTVEKGATDVGGAVVGMTPTSGGCTNHTTGQQVKFQHMVGATAGSCVVAGLVVRPGDNVQMHVQGVAE